MVIITAVEEAVCVSVFEFLGSSLRVVMRHKNSPHFIVGVIHCNKPGVMLGKDSYADAWQIERVNNCHFVTFFSNKSQRTFKHISLGIEARLRGKGTQSRRCSLLHDIGKPSRSCLSWHPQFP